MDLAILDRLRGKSRRKMYRRGEIVCHEFRHYEIGHHCQVHLPRSNGIKDIANPGMEVLNGIYHKPIFGGKLGEVPAGYCKTALGVGDNITRLVPGR